MPAAVIALFCLNERDCRAGCHDCRMKDLDRRRPAPGRWVRFPAYARVPAITARDDVAAVLVDSNGDGVDVDLDQYVREPEGTRAECLSRCVDDEGVG